MLDRSAVSVCARAEHAIYRLAVERPSWCTRASQLHGRNLQPKIEHLRAFHDRDELAYMYACDNNTSCGACSAGQLSTSLYYSILSVSKLQLGIKERALHHVPSSASPVSEMDVPTASSIADRVCFRRDGTCCLFLSVCVRAWLSTFTCHACLPINLCNSMHV
jgi:hypothetical protein